MLFKQDKRLAASSLADSELLVFRFGDHRFRQSFSFRIMLDRPGHTPALFDWIVRLQNLAPNLQVPFAFQRAFQ